MARALARTRENEEDRTPARGSDTVMVGGMDDLVNEAIEPEDEHEEVVAPPPAPERRVVADIDDGEDEPEQDARLAYDEEPDDERGPVSRRQRRNRARREALGVKDQQIAVLTQRVEQLAGMVGQTMQGHVGVALQNVETELRAAKGQLDIITAEIGRATAAGDGDAVTKAINLRDEAGARFQQLAALRTQVMQQAQSRAQPVHQQAAPRPALDPRAVTYSEIFMDRHPWFNPNGTDEASNLVKAIDETLEAEGLRPETKKYWLELENRVRARGIGGEASETDRNRRSSDAMPPTNGRRATRPGTKAFNLKPEMREYLESEGLLEDKSRLSKEDLARRDRLVRNWRDLEAKADRGELRRT